MHRTKSDKIIRNMANFFLKLNKKNFGIFDHILIQQTQSQNNNVFSLTLMPNAIDYNIETLTEFVLQT